MNLFSSWILVALLATAGCQFFPKTQPYPRHTSENEWIHLTHARLGLEKGKPVWQFDIVWKHKASLDLQITDTQRNLTLWEGKTTGSETTLTSNPIDPKDPNYRWIFGDSLRPTKVPIKIESKDIHGNLGSLEKWITVSPETKQSLQFRLDLEDKD